MLADFLLTPKQQRILNAFLLNLAWSFAISDIFELAEGERSSTQAFVKLLIDSKVLRFDLAHRSTRYAVNTEHPLFPELRQIAIKSFGIREPIEVALQALGGEIERAFIFGSIANATDRPDSDIDVMIIGDVRLGKATRMLDEAGRKLGGDIHVNVYPDAQWQALRAADPVVRAIDEGPRIELNVSPAAN